MCAPLNGSTRSIFQLFPRGRNVEIRDVTRLYFSLSEDRARFIKICRGIGPDHPSSVTSTARFFIFRAGPPFWRSTNQAPRPFSFNTDRRQQPISNYRTGRRDESTPLHASAINFSCSICQGCGTVVSYPWHIRGDIVDTMLGRRDVRVTSSSRRNGQRCFDPADLISASLDYIDDGLLS